VFVCVAPKLQVLVPSVPEKIHVLVAAIVPDLFFKKTKNNKKKFKIHVLVAAIVPDLFFSFIYYIHI